jgi:hypothetical protein
VPPYFLRAAAMSLLLLTLPLAGCYTWRPSDLAPDRTIRLEQPRAVRLTRTDGELVYLRSPVLDGDSIVGEQHRSGFAPVRITVPVDGVREAATSRFSPGRTVAFIAIPVIGIVALIVSQMSWVSYGSY